MNKTLLTVLALSCTMTANVAAQEYKGSAPVSGATYNLYNVGTKQFLGIENGRLVLGGEKVDVTLSAVNDTNTPGFFRLTSPDGTWHATSTALLLSKRTSSASGASSQSTARRTFTP